MKRFIFTLLFTNFLFATHAQVIDIATARASSVGTTVTVRGLVLNGSELGPIRYMQDNTGAIAAYDFSATADVLVGDSIEVTGVLDDYNALLEISPITSLTIINSGNPLPAPESVTLASGWAETYEAKLIKVDGVMFTETGTFSTAGSGNNYDITDGISTSQTRIYTSTNIDGSIIPEEEVSITGILSQYAPGGTGGYQLLPRSLTDISTGGNPPIISTSLTQVNINTTSFTVEFETLYEGTSIIYYGSTSTALINIAEDPSLVTAHSVDLTGLDAGSIYYVQGASVSASNDTSYSPVVAMATASNSTGDMMVWFNNPVDNSVSTGTNAVYSTDFAGLIIDYIDNALYSIDMTMYNIDNDNNIVTALNDAYQRGVVVRVICDADVNASAYSTLSIGAANKKLSPTGTTPDGDYYGIMHNKFIIIDAVSTDPDEPWVLSGSTNFTDAQLKIDKQNLIAIQDQSLAKAYRVEFEEMFNGYFGPEKTNNTPHEFVIGGKRVELYFSPSDDTESKIKSSIQSADHDLYFAVFSFTRFGISYEIEDMVDAGVFAAGIWDQTDAADPLAIDILESAMGTTLFEASGSPLLHHKYLIVDPNCPQADPLVLTGSHNWTSSANSRNDENTLIIHDSTIANIYYQEFSQRYLDEGGTERAEGDCDYVSIPAFANGYTFELFPNPANQSITLHNTAPELATNYTVFNLSGQPILSGMIDERLESISVQQLVSGLYMIQVQGNQGLETKTFLVQH